MTKVSIGAQINSFLEKNQDLKGLPREKILSIMVNREIITHAQASEYLKNSTFEQGYSSKIELIPVWETQLLAQHSAMEFLTQIIATSEAKIDTQDKSEGGISRYLNDVKEIFSTENRKSRVENEIALTKKDLEEFQKATSFEEFRAIFEKRRKVPFSPAKIEHCQKQADRMANTEIIKETIDNLKAKLSSSTVNNVRNSSLRGANNAILATFQTLGIKNKHQINQILKDIETYHKNNPEIQKYGGDFRIAKNKKGEYTIYRTAQNGKPAEATMEELQIIADEMKLRLNRAYGAAIGAEIPEKATNKEIEEITAQKFDEIKSDYETAFKEAYGGKNIKTLTDNYVQSQKQMIANVQMTLDITSMATMFLGSGMILKGASLLTKSTGALSTVTSATNVATKAIPLAIGAQISRPVDLIENLTAEEPDWASYGMSVKEGAMWMALGVITGGVGDKARMFLAQKGLSHVAKNTGKTIDQLINMYKSGHKLPAGLSKSLSLIENTAKISGTSAEFAADILATIGIQQARGEEVTLMDYVGSANGAILGTVMHKTFAKVSDTEKVKVIQKALLESNPHMSKKELEKASQALINAHRLAEEKRNPKTTEKLAPEEKKTFGKTVYELKQKAEKGDLKGLETTKNLSTKEMQDLVNVLQETPDIFDFLMTSVNEKPACWVDCPKNFDASKISNDNFEAITFKHPYNTIDAMVLVNKKMVRNLIEENTEIYQKRLGLDEKSSVDEIYESLIDDLKNGKGGFKQDLMGLTLGFGRDNAMIFELENLIPMERPHLLRGDLPAYKQAIKEALYSEDSPYKDFSDEFKEGFVERIDQMTEIGRVDIPGYVSVDYSRSIYDQNQRIEHLRAATKKLAEVNEESVVLTKEVLDKDGKPTLELNEAGEAKTIQSANEIHNKAEQVEKSILKIMKEVGLGTAGVNMTHRPKSIQSLYDKIKNELCNMKCPATFKEALASIRDAVGTRTELGDFDYKKHPDIVEMYKKDPKKAIAMAAERQSEEYVQKVKDIIARSVLDPDAKISAVRLSNYMGKDGIPYFSEKQVAILQDYASQYGVDLHIKNELTKVRPSGYTALQMNFVTKDGFTYEWQLRGSKVNKFAECEHVPYDIRENKDVTGGKTILKALYEPLETTVKNMTKEEYKNYNKYLTAHYEHLRLQELGFESKPPKLEDFGLTDPKLKAENLELLHDLADNLKNGNLDQQTALYTYISKTDKKSSISIPQNMRMRAENEKFAETDEAFKGIIENNKSAFKSISKIEDIDEFIRQGVALILDEMGLSGAPIKIEITDNLNEFSMSEATLRVSRNWAGDKLKHVEGKGDRAEILGAVAHELNHYLQNKEIYINALLRGDEFEYNLRMTDECQNLVLWGLGADDTGSIKYPYPMEQPDYNFQKANAYINNFANYIEPYKMVEVDGKKTYLQDERGNYVIDEESYEAYAKQLIEDESTRRGNIVRDEYKKLINEQ